ncbi:MAG: pyridoxal-phosphate dependent enzyme [Candidatus Aminicenantales bacterium]|jgi:threonine dehydratase
MVTPLSTGFDFVAGIRAAHERIRRDVVRTPVELSETLSDMTGARVLIKWESDQTTGSFKLRGALNKLRSLTPGERERGVVSASTGNHGLAISHAAKLEGIGLRLFLPATVSDIKRKKIEALGVHPEFFGSSCEQTEAHAREQADRTGRVFVSPYNDRDIVCGAGTVGLEIAEDAPGIDDVLVPVGGGGLIAGIAAYLRRTRPAARAVGVEPETSAFMAASVEAGRLVEIEEEETIADAVAGGIEPGAVTFPLYRDLVDRTLVVPEALIASSMALLFERHHKMIEGAGALPVAGLLARPGDFRGRSVLVVVSGRNVAPEKFRAITGLS